MKNTNFQVLRGFLKQSRQKILMELVKILQRSTLTLKNKMKQTAVVGIATLVHRATGANGAFCASCPPCCGCPLTWLLLATIAILATLANFATTIIATIRNYCDYCTSCESCEFCTSESCKK